MAIVRKYFEADRKPLDVHSQNAKAVKDKKDHQMRSKGEGPCKEINSFRNVLRNTQGPYTHFSALTVLIEISK